MLDVLVGLTVLSVLLGTEKETEFVRALVVIEVSYLICCEPVSELLVHKGCVGFALVKNLSWGKLVIGCEMVLSSLFTC